MQTQIQKYKEDCYIFKNYSLMANEGWSYSFSLAGCPKLGLGQLNYWA